MPSSSWEDLLNLADTEGGGFEPIPAKDYHMVITQADATKTKDGAKDMIKARAKVIDEGPGKGRLVFHQFTITRDNPKAMAMFFRQMGVLGLDREFFRTHEGVAPIAEGLVGAVFKAKVGIKTYNGKQDNEILNFSTATEAARAAALNVGVDSPTAAPAGPTPPSPTTTAAAPPAAPAPAPAAAVPPPPPAAAPAPPAAPPAGVPAPPPPPSF